MQPTRLSAGFLRPSLNAVRSLLWLMPMLVWAQDTPSSAPRPSLPSDTVVGRWAGSQNVGEGARAILFCADGLQMGARRHRLTYGAPNGCYVDAEHAQSRSDGTQVFSIAFSSGGRCNHLIDGFVFAVPTSRDEIEVTVTDKKGVKDTAGIYRLKRVNAAEAASAPCIPKAR